MDTMNENTLLQGNFLFFDSNASNSDGHISNNWSKESPRKVTVTFEKNPMIADGSYCLRLKDETGHRRAVFFPLDKSSFCGTDCGNLVRNSSCLFCLKWKSCYQYLAVFLDANTRSQGTSCVLLKTNWPDEDRSRWQSTIENHLGVRHKWCVTQKSTEAERGLLCLTETGLAFNKPSFSVTTFPSNMWHYTFEDFKIVTSYNEQEIMEIIAVRRGHENKDVHRYEVKTSHGNQIANAVCRPHLPISPNHSTLEAAPSIPLPGDSDGPSPCTGGTLFIKTPEIPKEGEGYFERRPPSPKLEPTRISGGHRNSSGRRIHGANRSIAHWKSLRRSFSMGEKELLMRTKSRKALLQEKTSVSGGYDSDSDYTCPYPLTISDAVKAADRGTLYMHQKWYQSFKSSVTPNEDSNSHPTSLEKRASTNQRLRSFSFGNSGEESSTIDRDQHSQRLNTEEYDYWTGEVSFTLQNILDDKHPDPDTMKLDWKQRTRLNFHLYPFTAGIQADWHDLGDYLGLSYLEISMVEHFCMVHQRSPVNVLLDHWQFVYNKQIKKQAQNPDLEAIIPPCLKSELIQFLQQNGRNDVLEISKLTDPTTP